jgi:hypothetical protein
MKGRITVAALTILALVASVSFTWAQGKAHLTELRELEHDTSPPLDKIPPLPPQAGPTQVIPLRLTHGPFAPHPEKADQALQTTTTTSSLPGTSQNFLGLGNGFTGPNGSFTVQYIPPDTNGAAGETQFVQWVNASFAVFDKATGNPTYGPAAGNTLWSALGGPCARNNSGDPIAQYDKIANRWVLMQPVFKSPYYLCVAVSTSSDATGSYNLYSFPIPNKLFPDYPKLGVWPDGYYVTYNQFQGNFFQGPAACALDRAAMLNGQAATMQCAVSIGTQYGSMLPGDFDGTTVSLPPAGAGDYFLNLGSNSASLDLWQMHVDWSNVNNSVLTHLPNIGVTPFTEACGGGTCIPQSGTSQQLDSLGDRLMYRLAYRNFGTHQSLVVNHSVDTGIGYTGVRWYELQNTGGGFGLYQEGTYAPDSSYRWMGSIAQDAVGDIALGYSISSSSTHPAIGYTGRVPSDPVGTMESENVIYQGGGSQTSYARWGDYSSMAIDPTDDCTFWYTTEYQPTNGNAWATRIASFAFPGCGGTASPSFSLSASPASFSVTQGSSTGSTLTVSPSGDYTGHVSLSYSAPSGSGITVTFGTNPVDISGTGSGSSSLTVAASSTAPTGTYTVTITGTDTSVSPNLTSSTDLSVTVNAPASPDFSMSASPSSLTLTQGNTGTSTVSVTASNGFNGTVGLAVSGCPNSPANVCSLSPSSISNGSGSATLTVTTDSTTPTGIYNIVVTGTSGSLSHTASVTLTVNAPAAGDFSISASPGNVVLRGAGTATYNVSISSLNGYTGTVTVSVGNLPPNSTGSSATITGGSGSAALTVTTTSQTPTGSYTLIITGTDVNNLTHSTTVGLKVH